MNFLKNNRGLSIIGDMIFCCFFCLVLFTIFPCILSASIKSQKGTRFFSAFLESWNSLPNYVLWFVYLFIVLVVLGIFFELVIEMSVWGIGRLPYSKVVEFVNTTNFLGLRKYTFQNPSLSIELLKEANRNELKYAVKHPKCPEKIKSKYKKFQRMGLLI